MRARFVSPFENFYLFSNNEPWLSILGSCRGLRTDSDNIKVPIAALRRAFSLFEAIYKLF
jgi:hypothetical protein